MKLVRTFNRIRLRVEYYYYAPRKLKAELANQERDEQCIVYMLWVLAWPARVLLSG